MVQKTVFIEPKPLHALIKKSVISTVDCLETALWLVRVRGGTTKRTGGQLQTAEREQWRILTARVRRGAAAAGGAARWLHHYTTIFHLPPINDQSRSKTISSRAKKSQRNWRNDFDLCTFQKSFTVTPSSLDNDVLGKQRLRLQPIETPCGLGDRCEVIA